MKRLLTAIAAVVGLSGCKPSNPLPSQATATISKDREAVHFAVLGVLNDRLLQINPTSAWIEHMTLEHIDENDRRIQGLSAWAKSLPPGVDREEYLDWLRWFKCNDDDARKDIINQTTKRHMDEYSRSTEDLFRRARKVEIPRP